MCSITECAVRVEDAGLGLGALFKGALVGGEGLVRGPCLRLVGERVFFVGAGEGSEFGGVVGGGSMGEGWGR